MSGATQLTDKILDAIQEKPVSELRIGLESTSVYRFYPSMFLHNNESIQALGGCATTQKPNLYAKKKRNT